MSFKNMNVVVYTSIIGGFDQLKEDQVCDGIPFHAFVDGNAVSATWNVNRVVGLFRDARRSARMYKILSHALFPDADITVWVDGSVSVTSSLWPLLEEFSENGWDLATFQHPERNCIYQEAESCKAARLDEFGVIDRQVQAYKLKGYPADAGLYETSVLIRKNTQKVRDFNNAWWAELCMYSRRDQLSMPYVARETGMHIGIVPGNPQNLPHINPRRNGSRYFSWTDHAGQPHYQIGDGVPQEINSVGVGNHGQRDLRSWFVISKVGTRIYVNNDDRRGRQLILSRGNFNPNSLLIWEFLVNSGKWSTIVDVGANYGEMLLNLRFPAETRVVAVEPNPMVRQYLECSLKDAEYEVEVIEYAITSSDGKARFLMDKDWSGTSKVIDGLPDNDRDGGNEFIEVDCITLSTLLDQQGGISGRDVLIKVDVEGNEVKVFEGIIERLHEFNSLTAMVEILFFESGEMAWFLERFDVYLLELSSRALVKVNPPTPDVMKRMIETKKFYPQDAVIRLPQRKIQQQSRSVENVPSILSKFGKWA